MKSPILRMLLPRWVVGALAGALACMPEPAPSGDPECLRVRGTLEGDDPLAYTVAWAPSSDYALGGTEHELRLLAVEDEGWGLRIADRVVGDDAHVSVAWSADETRALSVGGDGRVHLYEIDLEAERLRPLTDLLVDAQGLLSVALAPDERHALACGIDGFLSLLRVDLPHAELSVVDRYPAHLRCVFTRWSPAGTHAVSLGPRQSVLVYRLDPEAETLEVVALMQQGEEPGTVAFGRDEHELWVGTFGEGHRVAHVELDLDEGSVDEHPVVDDFASGVKVVEPAHDPRTLVIADHDGAPRLYRRAEGPALRLVARLDDDGTGSHAVSWSPDDRFALRAASRLDRFEVLTTQGCSLD